MECTVRSRCPTPVKSRVSRRAATLSLVTDDPSDAQLLALARRGDGDAFRRLVERYEPVVAATVIGMLGRGADADDVGQDTFVRFHCALADFRQESALKTYLVRIAMNLSLNALKQRKRQQWRFPSRDDAGVNVPELAAASPTMPLDEAAERREVVQRAVARLAEKHRAVVTLRLLQGLSVRETAQALGVPDGTVLSRRAPGSEQVGGVVGPYIRDGAMPEVHT